MGPGVSPSNESLSDDYLGRESWSNCLAAGKGNLITYFFKSLTKLLFKKTWLSGETEVACISYTNI